MTSLLSGFAISLSLILAIGAQNAFVLRQGLRRAHVFWVALTCSVIDALLITAGIMGFGALATAAPWFETILLWGGAAFLIWYGWQNAKSAWRGGTTLEAATDDDQTLRQALVTILALSLLNPHVYLDTVVFVGSISAQYDNRFAFGIGAVTASFTFFFSLAYGARFLRPLFSNPRSWQILDGLIALVMWSIAAALLLS
ncbi:MAG: L-lysine exporter family protein LysE/ArgO [Ascidiaceihabitans sp.]|jgi:L-lysine exporter family protein LysE/ArgO